MPLDKIKLKSINHRRVILLPFYLGLIYYRKLLGETVWVASWAPLGRNSQGSRFLVSSGPRVHRQLCRNHRHSQDIVQKCSEHIPRTCRIHHPSLICFFWGLLPMAKSSLTLATGPLSWH